MTGLAGLPVPLSEIGGGVLNGANAMWQSTKHVLHFDSAPIDTDGPYWLAKQNHANIFQGYSDGLAANQPSQPFNDFGLGAKPQSTESQIGDGNGITDWISSLSGVDPQEPTPPTWPPSDTPVRYLARRTR